MIGMDDVTPDERDAEIAAAWVDGVRPRLDAPVYLAEYEPAWPEVYEEQAARIRRALGERVRLLEHAGSTAVPGLVAKPRIDILLGLDDPADEDGYVPALAAEGFRLVIREPELDEHRMFIRDDMELNLHVHPVGSIELDRMLLFRDWLRRDAADRALYAATKRKLASRVWGDVQHYADAKGDVVQAIMARALADRVARATEAAG